MCVCQFRVNQRGEGEPSVVYIKPVVSIAADDDWVTVNVCVTALLEAKRDPLLSSEILKNYTAKRLTYKGCFLLVCLDTQ